MTIKVLTIKSADNKSANAGLWPVIHYALNLNLRVLNLGKDESFTYSIRNNLQKKPYVIVEVVRFNYLMMSWT